MHPSRVPVSALVRAVLSPARTRNRFSLVIAAVLLAFTATAARALPLEITTTSLPDGTAGVAYSQAVVAASGTTPYAWSIVVGSLPSGYSIDSGTGIISGTSNVASTSHFIVHVSDAVSDTATKALSIAIAPAAAAALTFEVQPSNVVAGVSIAPAVQVKVADAFGNGVVGESVSLSLIGTGALTGGGAVVTDGSGLATFSGLSVDLSGSKQLSASSGVLTPAASASFTVSSAAAATLAFEVQPSSITAGATIAPAVQVKVTDAFGNGVPTELVSLSLVGTGTLTGGGAVATDAAGVATFAGLSVDLVGSKQLTATSGALTPPTSAAFTVSAAAAAALTFDVQPSNVVAGATITPAVQVKVADSFGNPVADEFVSLSLVGTGSLTGGGALATDAAGLVVFASLSVDLVGSKQLTASSGALSPATSASFTVSAATASAVTFEVQPSNVIAGATLSPAVQVKVADAFGNGISGELVSLSLVGTGALTGGGAVATDASGLAMFAALSVDVPGSKQLSATSGALGPVLSASFNVACPTLTVNPATLPSGSTGDAYSQVLTATGGQAPYTFAITAGSLPPGLTLDANGLLSETPTTTGQFEFTVTATDANLCTGARAYTLIVCGTVSVLPASLPDAQQGAPYSQALSGTGGVAPYTFAITAGALPAGLTLSGAGLLAGTPTVTGVFNFSVTATSTGGCAGSTPFTLTVPGVPAAATNLAAVRRTSGNDADGTARIELTFTPSTFTSTIEVYRAPFGGYPRYDDAGGALPPTPSYPPGAPWILTSVTASGQTDEPATRDAWSYVVFLKNSVGQASAVSNKTPPTPNYALGDVSNGIVAGAGDNLVSDLDVSLLGAHYGISNGAITSAGVHYLDVGPTTNLAVTSRPFTDNRIDFEDLIVFATNYGAVSSPASVIADATAAARSAKGSERLALRAPSLVESGETFEAVLDMSGAGRVQGLSAELAWDPSVVEPIGMASTGWVESQNGVVLSSHPGTVDAALLGARATGLRGTGTIAKVTFRARRVGDPALRLARVLARDAANRPLAEGALEYSAQAAAPTRTLLFAPAPNPSQGASTMSFALSQSGDVELSIFSVDGRRVRTLARGPFEAGGYRFTWNGDDDERRSVAPGVYYAQLTANGRRYSRTVVHLQ